MNRETGKFQPASFPIVAQRLQSGDSATCINHGAAYHFICMTQAGQHPQRSDPELLPPRQRLAWIAVIWAFSVGAIGCVTWLIQGLIT